MRSSALTLGLDLGVTSVGWALANIEEQLITATGVRLYDAPINLAQFEKGEPGGSHAAQRRQSRLQRRQIRRRQTRHRNLYLALQSAGMLPFAGKKAEDRHKKLEKLDIELARVWKPVMRTEAREIADPDQILCYFLRAVAATRKVDLDALGRALYHLGQRRGFKSNRREGRASTTAGETKKVDEERSRIKSSIKSREESLERTGLTLGQQLALVNPHVSAIRNRKRPDIEPIWTSRRMYQDEFERIWTTQAPHYPELLTDKFKRRIEGVIFKQRDVSSGKPGNCELERNPALPRAPRSSLTAQRFRVVQTVNNLRASDPQKRLSQQAWREKQRALILLLETAISKPKGKRVAHDRFGLTFTEVKAEIGLSARAKLNLDEEDASSYLRGNRTNAIMARAFGNEIWSAKSEAEKRRIVRGWITEPSPEKLIRTAKEQWSLPDNAAEELASFEPEDGYASLSHVAMHKLLIPMEERGLTYAEAVNEVYGNVLSGGEEHKYLPPVEQVFPSLSNPVVRRTLTELRKVVNEIIRSYGRPFQIRIELARDLKRNAEQRAKLHSANKEHASERIAAKRWLEERGERPTDRSIRKVLLYRRCKDCVYCTKPLGSLEDVIRENSAIEDEHVLPKRCNDNSFANMVLAHRACNLRKGDRTPRQAWDPSPEWDEMLKLVQSLKDKALLDRFTISTETELQQFTNRHLADTRYISKLATEYVELLYGGRDAAVPWEDRSRRCVYASSGVMTAELRKRWGLQNVLQERNQKPDEKTPKARDDHRHHAVDAIVIALTTGRILQQATFEMQRYDRNEGHLSPRYFSPPWPQLGEIENRISSFRQEIKAAVKAITVSHRVNHRLQGELHDANPVGKPRIDREGIFVNTRKEVHRLSDKDVEAIHDEAVKTAVKQKAEELGKLELCEKQGNWPTLRKPDGSLIKIRKVTLKSRRNKEPLGIGNDRNKRYVIENNNHHVVIFQQSDTGDRARWYTHGPVSRFEAMTRLADAKRAGTKPPHQIISAKDGSNSAFVMSLMKGDCVEMRDPVNDVLDIYRVASMSEDDYAFIRHNVSMPSAKDLGLTTSQLRQLQINRGDRVRIRANIDELRKLDCKKVNVDPLGRVTYL
jgi:CRISPR-associated endonuclease Csn1